jgi:hypothetical protein
MQKAVLTFVASIALTVSLGATSAPAQQRFQAGVLTCRLGPSVGLILGSRQRMRCEFVKPGGRRENYSGSVTRFGLDLGITVGGVMRWTVLARTRVTGRGILAGHYVGASGDISLGVGIGANALIGGSRRSTVLQPLSVAGQIGINLAVGVAGLTLRYAGG